MIEIDPHEEIPNLHGMSKSENEMIPTILSANSMLNDEKIENTLGVPLVNPTAVTQK